MKRKRTTPEVNTASARQLWAMKRASQARDRNLIASKAVAPETMFFIRPNKVRSARIKWPDTFLRDTEGEEGSEK